MSVNTKLAAQAVTPPMAQRKSAEPEETLADKMSVGFDDLLDVVNPLQQLPVVSSVYREATGKASRSRHGWPAASCSAACPA